MIVIFNQYRKCVVIPKRPKRVNVTSTIWGIQVIRTIAREGGGTDIEHAIHVKQYTPDGDHIFRKYCFL